MIKRPYFVDYTFGSTNSTSGSYLEGVRSGVETGYPIYHVPVDFHFGYLNELTKIPYGSNVMLDFEPWTDQGPVMGNYMDSPYDEDVITAYNTRYVAMMELVAPIARARQLRCSIYDYPATYWSSGNQWIIPDASIVNFQRQLLDQCEDEGLLDFLRTPEFSICPACYISSHDSWSVFNTPGDTQFQAILSNMTSVFREYEVGYQLLLQVRVRSNQIWNAVQQKAIYKHAVMLGYQWERDADDSLHYRNVRQMQLWEEASSLDSGQTASVAQEIVDELDESTAGAPYRQQISVPESFTTSSELRTLQRSAAIYLPFQDKHNQKVCYPAKLSQSAGIQTLVRADQITVPGPGGLTGISLNGTNQYLEIDLPTAYLGATSFSGSLCFSRDTTPSGFLNVLTAWRAGRCMYMVRVSTSGNTQIQISNNIEGNVVTSHAAVANVCDGEWHWIQWCLTGGKMSIWIDGNLIVNQENSRSALTTPEYSPGNVIGATYNNTHSITGYSSHKICHLGLWWNTAITSNQFETLRSVF